MLIAETFANVQKTIEHIASKRKKPLKEPHLIAAPQSFIDQIHEIYAKEADMSVDAFLEENGPLYQIHGAVVVTKNEIVDPILITPTGKVHQILPMWARAKTIAAGSKKSLILLK